MIQGLAQKDPQTTQLFINRMQQFRPRLVMNMIEDPKDADRATRIKSSCNQYLGLEIEYLGLMYRDMLQDKALASQLPVVVYKPQSVLGQAVYRIADKVISTPAREFDSDFNPDSFNGDNFQDVEEDANEDFNFRLSGKVVGADFCDSLNVFKNFTDLLFVGNIFFFRNTPDRKPHKNIYELKKENNLLKSKLIKASQQGFKI